MRHPCASADMPTVGATTTPYDRRAHDCTPYITKSETLPQDNDDLSATTRYYDLHELPYHTSPGQNSTAH